MHTYHKYGDQFSLLVFEKNETYGNPYVFMETDVYSYLKHS